MSICESTGTYDLGATVICDIEFRDPDSGALVDPTTPRAQFQTPNGVTTTYTYVTDAQLVKDAVGQYHFNVDANQAGTWYYRGYSTGSYKGAKESSFEVNPSKFS